MYHDGLSYKKISNILNEEKVLDKTNWRDSTILNILENPIYKGDFIMFRDRNIIKPPAMRVRAEKAIALREK